MQAGSNRWIRKKERKKERKRDRDRDTINKKKGRIRRT
jgi:hypothetical protein